MPYQITSSICGDIELANETTGHLNASKLPGSTLLSAQDAFGEMMLQKTDCDQCSLLYSVYRIRENVTFYGTSELPLLEAHFALKNKMQCDMQGVGGMHLQPGQFNMFHAPFLDNRNTLEKGMDYIAFDILYPVYLLEQLAEDFPSASLFVEKIHAGKPALLEHEHMWMGAALNGIIGRILHFPPGEAGWKFFLENKVREILYQVMVQTGKRYHVKPALTKSEMESIHAAKEIILANMEHHFTISQIARKVCLNDFKLKRGFVKLFGLGPYEFLLQARMNRARELILDSDKSIKEIAALTGYTLLSSFTTAFKKRFHCTPGLLRKNK